MEILYGGGGGRNGPVFPFGICPVVPENAKQCPDSGDERKGGVEYIQEPIKSIFLFDSDGCEESAHVSVPLGVFPLYIYLTASCPCYDDGHE